MSVRGRLTLPLLERGLAEHDAEVLARREAATKVLGKRTGSPLDVLAGRVTDGELTLILGVVADALAAGPHGPFAAPWRRLFEAGCPLDHVWCTLWHAFKDPAVDYQDEGWLAPADGMANVERYVALGFPRLQMPSMFGPGLGCAALLANASAAAAELLRLGAPSLLVVDGLCAGRAALTAPARREVDAAAGIEERQRVARPSAEALAALRGKLERGDFFSDAEYGAWRFHDLPEDREDHLLSDDAPWEEIAIRWFEAVREGLSTGRVVLDEAQDRYRLDDEPSSMNPARALRSALSGPLPRPVELDALLASWSARDPMGGLPRAEQLEQEDPILWLRAIAEALDAAELGEDELGGDASSRRR